MSILKLIAEDHEKVRGIFQKMKDTTDRAEKTRTDLLEKLKKELEPHMEAEEKLFYPWVREHADAEDEVLEGLEEHHVTRRSLKELESLAVNSEKWKPRMTVLFELVDHHAEEEEDEIFKHARKHLNDEESEKLAEKFKEIKNNTSV
jgi:iron-sulfur cluster repair protein YtfE (RIC family)